VPEQDEVRDPEEQGVVSERVGTASATTSMAPIAPSIAGRTPSSSTSMALVSHA
jgi:hypothetical protein